LVTVLFKISNKLLHIVIGEVNL